MPRAEEFYVFGGRGDPSMVLLPGWATDGRVFDGLFPGVPAVTTGALRPEGFPGRLAAFLARTAGGPVTVVGWSLGGFLAAEFAREYPGLVRRVVLVGIRRRYPAEEVAAVRASLLHDRAACLSAFYAQCFFPSRGAARRRFRAELQPEYMKSIDDATLLAGLGHLSSAAIDGAGLPGCPVAIVHGERDAVAPAAEAQGLARESGSASFHLLPGAPHAAMFGEGFAEAVARG